MDSGLTAHTMPAVMTTMQNCIMTGATQVAPTVRNYSATKVQGARLRRSILQVAVFTNDLWWQRTHPAGALANHRVHSWQVQELEGLSPQIWRRGSRGAVPCGEERKVTHPIRNDRVGRIADFGRLKPKPLEPLQLGGAMSRTLFGNLNGVYTLECEQVPSEEEIRQALRLRVQRDSRQYRDRGVNADLASWHGGWTCEGIGIFSADIWCSRSGERTRHLGRACVNVQTVKNSGSRMWNGIAC